MRAFYPRWAGRRWYDPSFEKIVFFSGWVLFIMVVDILLIK